MDFPGQRRQLLGCSVGENLLGAAPAWVSLLIMFLIGVLLGLGAGILCATRRGAKHKRQADVEQQGAPQQLQQQPKAQAGFFASQQAKKGKVPSNGLSPPHPADCGPLGSRLETSEKHRYLVSASSGIRAATATAAPVCSPVPVPDTTAQGSLATVACGLSQARSLPRNPSLPVAADNPFTEGAESVPATGSLQPSTSAASSELQTAAGLRAAAGTQKPVKELDARKQARKAQDAAQVAPEYQLDELTDEWQSALQNIDDRLYQAGRPTLDARERSVVMRCLIESTARESSDTAVHRAVGTVERLRRMHAHSPSMQPRV